MLRTAIATWSIFLTPATLPPLSRRRQPLLLRAAILHREQAAPRRDRHRFGAAGGAEFGEEGTDVELGGVFADAELAGDRLVREPGGNQLQDLTLPRRQWLPGGHHYVGRGPAVDVNTGGDDQRRIDDGQTERNPSHGGGKGRRIGLGRQVGDRAGGESRSVRRRVAADEDQRG